MTTINVILGIVFFTLFVVRMSNRTNKVQTNNLTEPGNVSRKNYEKVL